MYAHRWTTRDEGTILQADGHRIEDFESEDPFRLQVAEADQCPLAIALLNERRGE
jgi:hypothetical protein